MWDCVLLGSFALAAPPTFPSCTHGAKENESKPEASRQLINSDDFFVEIDAFVLVQRLGTFPSSLRYIGIQAQSPIRNAMILSGNDQGTIRWCVDICSPCSYLYAFVVHLYWKW